MPAYIAYILTASSCFFFRLFSLEHLDVHRILFRSIDSTLYVTYCYLIYLPCLLLGRSGAMVSILLEFVSLERKAQVLFQCL